MVVIIPLSTSPRIPPPEPSSSKRCAIFISSSLLFSASSIVVLISLLVCSWPTSLPYQCIASIQPEMKAALNSRLTTELASLLRRLVCKYMCRLVSSYSTHCRLDGSLIFAMQKVDMDILGVLSARFDVEKLWVRHDG